jgi:hypothetical protein
VNCEVCGTELPHGALFCGECGRAVGTRVVRTVNPDSGMPESVRPDNVALDDRPEAESPESDDQPDSLRLQSRDTAIIERITPERLPELESELTANPEPAERSESVAGSEGAESHPYGDGDGDGDGEKEFDEEFDGDDAGGDDGDDDEVETGIDAVEQDLPPDVLAEEAAEAEAESPPEPEPEPQPHFEPELPPEPVSSTQSAFDGVAAVLRGRSNRPAESSSPLTPRPDPFPWGDRGSAIFSDSDELEQTLIVPRRETGERFVLQFSTGESVTVFGSGLLGRNPIPQPTEYFDQIVSISDPGKSVSKTHLEFGQESGSFWVSDRYSGNGSTVREPESSPRRLVAGKRYRIVRGTRVDIGEQFFVVS